MSGKPKIVYITAGAGGMYCGSCIRDNSLAAGLSDLGWDVTLLPLYTPIRVDEEDQSDDQVFFGGVNVFLQQKIPLFRHLPAFMDRWLDNPKLIRRVASRAVNVDGDELGSLTLSMVKGEHGFQRKEVGRLVDWFKAVGKPDLICLTNLLVSGCVPALQRELGIPVLVTLQGDDVFLDQLKPAWRDQVLVEMKRLAAEADGFITFSNYYRDFMGGLLNIPKEKFHLTPLGVEVGEFNSVFEARKERQNSRVIGYFARLSPEKGLDQIVEAFIGLAKSDTMVRLQVGGWLSPKDSEFFESQKERITAAGLADRFAHVEAPDGEAKLEFLKTIDVFCVPAAFVEPKGLYLLEAMACGLPVVAPDQGALSEMVKASEGGAIFEHGNVESLIECLRTMVEDTDTAAELGANGRAWVIEYGDRSAMARATGEVFERALAERQKGVKALS